MSGDDEPAFRTYHQRWQALVEAMRSGGGTLEYTPASGTKVTYDVLSMRVTDAPYDGVQMLGWVQFFGFEFTCLPYGRLDPVSADLHDVDTFATDSLSAGDWSYILGSGTLSISGSVLVPSDTTQKRLIRDGITIEDGAATIKVKTGASVASGETGLLIKRTGATTWLDSNIAFVGASSALTIRKVVSGTATALAASSTFTTTAGASYWLRVSAAGNVITAKVFTEDPFVNPSATPLRSVSHTLASGDEVTFGDDVYGEVGLRLLPADTDYEWDDWRLSTKDLRSSNPVVVAEVPNVPGHVEALGDLTVYDAASQERNHVEVGLDAGDSGYRSASPAPVLLDSTRLETGGHVGAGATRTGAFDPIGSGSTVVRATLTPNAPVSVCGTGSLSHVGDHRVKARVYGSGTGPMYVRLAWRSGNSGLLTRNDWVKVPALDKFHEVDLGLIHIAVAAADEEQSWSGQIEVKTDTSGDTVDVDYVFILGAYRYSKSRWVPPYGAITVVSSSDRFDQAGNPSLGSGTMATKNQITGVTIATTPTVTTAAVHGLSAGSSIYIEEVGGVAGINGFWTVNTVPTTTTFTVSTTTSGTYTASTGVVVAGGQGGSGGPATAGPSGGGTFANLGSGASWSNMGNAGADDGSNASATGDSTSAIKALQITNFGFGIPASATVDGIKVEIKRRASHSGNNYVNFEGTVSTGLWIVKGGAKTGTQKYDAIEANKWPTTLAYKTYGSSTDKWGVTWAASDINASNFGIYIAPQVNEYDRDVTAYIDYVRITVYYTSTGSGNWYTLSARSSLVADFTIDSTNKVAQRTATTDGANLGRTALPGTLSLTDVAAQVEAKASAALTGTGAGVGSAGLVLRQVSSDTCFLVHLSAGTPYTLRVRKANNGTYTSISTTTLAKSAGSGQAVTIRALVTRNGRWYAWADGVLVASGWDADLAPGGVLASGKVGLYDEHNGAANTRTYDNFYAWVPEADAAVFSGLATRLRWADAIRQSEDGSSWGPAPGFEGARLRIPPARDAGLVSRIAVKARRNDIDQLADDGISDTTGARLDLTPRVLLLG